MNAPAPQPAFEATIHPQAIVEPGARLAAGVSVGPFCRVGAGVTLAEGVQLISHAVVAGDTHVGARTRIFPFASIGHEPQDLKYRGEESRLVIGADCVIREGVTMNPGTEGGGLLTEVGHHCAFLANAHVAHDCRLGDHVILSNNVMLAGHTRVGDYAILGGGAAVHQYVRIGAHAFIGGLAGVENDVIPYGMALGNRAALAGLNLVGLKRRGFSREAIQDLRRAYRLLFAAEGTLKERVEDVGEEFAAHPQVHEILDFIRDGGDRALCTPREAREASA
jgi:UDP-N-acetylglucosamine acyltransferase